MLAGNILDFNSRTTKFFFDLLMRAIVVQCLNCDRYGNHTVLALRTETNQGGMIVIFQGLKRSQARITIY